MTSERKGLERTEMGSSPRPRAMNSTTSSSSSVPRADEADGGGGRRYIKTMVTIDGWGALSLRGIESVELTERCRESANGDWRGEGGVEPMPLLEYGIVINRSMEPSQAHPKVDIELWFRSEEERDSRFRHMRHELEERCGVRFVDI